ncbi:hypothetical protein KDE13_09040 [Campylobacter sp. faydin G-140]|uniref:hypothetical protein n=1 Tax=Campylobacter anatolicus TaxID=2829105 RepID=UPI001B9B2C39|nr:hypothetical protein [Campylobacter anatolicus]MBR8466478.1 hypothetical protein [Campylobacter anatolicus]
MKTIYFILVASLCFTGCTFKTQTNPLPENNEVVLPRNYTFSKEGKISKEAKTDFDRYAKLILTDKNANEDSIQDLDETNFTELHYDKAINPHRYNRNSIWQTGLEISKRELDDIKTVEKGAKK